MIIPIQKLPDYIKPEAAIFSGNTWFITGTKSNILGDDELKRWIPAPAGNAF